MGTLIRTDTFWLDDKAIYKLKVFNPHTGKMVTSETHLVHDFEIFNPTEENTLRLVPEPQFPKIFSWETARYAARYQFEMIFRYQEVTGNGTTVTDKSLQITFLDESPNPEQYVRNYEFYDHLFFNKCAGAIPYSNPADEDEVIERFSGNLDFVYTLAAEDLVYYMISESSTEEGYFDNPLYSNIRNGTGLFSARWLKVRSKKLHTETIAHLKSMNLKFTR
jgi:hypothetical protein